MKGVLAAVLVAAALASPVQAQQRQSQVSSILAAMAEVRGREIVSRANIWSGVIFDLTGARTAPPLPPPIWMPPPVVAPPDFTPTMLQYYREALAYERARALAPPPLDATSCGLPPIAPIAPIGCSAMTPQCVRNGQFTSWVFVCTPQ